MAFSYLASSNNLRINYLPSPCDVRGRVYRYNNDIAESSSCMSSKGKKIIAVIPLHLI